MSGAEDARMVEEALHCAETGNAGHWPTAAGFLAAEVYRLRAELAETRAAGDALAEAAQAIGRLVWDGLGETTSAACVSSASSTGGGRSAGTPTQPPADDGPHQAPAVARTDGQPPAGDLDLAESFVPTLAGLITALLRDHDDPGAARNAAAERCASIARHQAAAGRLGATPAVDTAVLRGLLAEASDLIDLHLGDRSQTARVLLRRIDAATTTTDDAREGR